MYYLLYLDDKGKKCVFTCLEFQIPQFGPSFIFFPISNVKSILKNEKYFVDWI